MAYKDFSQGLDSPVHDATHDAKPIGSVSEVSGEATITRTDGHTEPVTLHADVYQGDVIDAKAHGAVNITLSDQSSFAISEGAHLTLDKYTFDPGTQGGQTAVSILKGIFIYTSGLIGRDDPDSVHINTPAGSIGIRGTIIAGNVTTGEITVVEGAIVLRDTHGHEMTLANQFETARFDTHQGSIAHMGEISAHDMLDRFGSVASVTPSFFSSIQDVAGEHAPANDDHHDQDSNQDNSGASGDDNGDKSSGDDAGGKDAPAGDDAAPPAADGTQPQTNSEATPATSSDNALASSGLGPATLASNGLGLTVLALSTSAQSLNSLGPMAGGMGSHDPGFNNGTVGYGQSHDPIVPPQSNGPAYDPNANQTNTNHDPYALGSAPDMFLRVSDVNPDGGSNTSWSYDFKGLFGDADGAGGLTFSLSQATQDMLASHGITYSWVDGKLVLTIPSADSAGYNFNLDIVVTDPHGASVTQQYNFQVVDTVAFTDPNADGSIDSSVIGSTIRETSSAQIIQIDAGAHGNTIFMSGNFAFLNIDGDDNTIHAGQNGGTFTLSNAATDNTIYGGAGQDSMDVHNGNNNVYGMGGNDTITLNFGGSNINTNLATSAGTHIDGGTGFDTLVLQGAGSIDFSHINQSTDNRITNIEMIDANNANAQTITLSTQDLLQMTDSNHDLFVNLDSSDTLTFNGQDISSLTPTGTYNNGGTIYNVYDLGNGATLYVHTS